MSSADVHGKFLWHELATTDPSAATAFYSKVLGWKAQPWDKDPTYTVWMAAKGPAGGAMKLPADASGGPSWVAYIGVRDIRATVDAAQRLGGRVVVGVTQIGNENAHYAVLADPQGGVFGVHAPAGGGGGAGGEFSWHELATSDYAAAQRFYFELFGWRELATHDMGPDGKYALLGVGSTQYGGMFNRPGHMPGSFPHWLSYVSVASASKAAEAAKASGGRVLNGPMQVPGGGWIAQLLDAQGAAIAVHEAPATAAAPPPKAAKPAAPKASAAKPAAAPKPAPAKAKAAAKKKAAPKKKAAKKAKPARKKAAAKRKSAARRAAPRRKAAKKKRSAARRKK